MRQLWYLGKALEVSLLSEWHSPCESGGDLFMFGFGLKEGTGEPHHEYPKGW